jgi:polysaccharide pyruvyl transferase WcaK-like protein
MSMRKILVMIPAGEVYDHACVRWYDYQNLARNMNDYHNIGDAFVYDSSLKLLDFDQVDVLNISDPSPADIDRYNTEYDFAFLRGSNYIHAAMDWEHAADVLEKLKIPVLAFGIGAQAASKQALALSAETKRVLHLIGSSTTSIGVRGAYTAEVLKSIGIENTRIVGCPTAFRRNDPNLRIDLPPLDTVKKVGFTLRREVSSAYARNIERYLTVHRDSIKTMATRFDIELMAQGEVEEKKLVLGDARQRAEALATLRLNEWMAQWFLDETIIDLYKNRLFYSDVVAEYDARVLEKDLVLGYRLHGNLMALANAVPAIYFKYDTRTSEFADTFAIPSYDVFSGKPFDLEALWQQSLFDRFNDTYRLRYRAMHDFLDENGIAHTMRSTPDAVDPQPVVA